MGSEHYGLCDELLEIADQKIYIPMVGMVQSYNISVAASLVMYQAFLQKGKHCDMDLINSLRGERNGDSK